MKITAVEVLALAVPRLSGYGATDQTVPILVAIVRTDAGIDGVGLTMAPTQEHAGSLHAMVRELGEKVIGMDPLRPEPIHAKMIYPANWFGPGGMLNIAAAAIDIAIWDIIGKDAGQPLWKVLGGFDDSCRIYDSGSLLLSDLQISQRRASDAIASGHRAIKMRAYQSRMAGPDAVRAEVLAIREAIGPEVDLLLDINQQWDTPRAIRVGSALDDLDLFWIEDPTSMHDIAGQASIADALITPICSGEYHYTASALRQLMEARAVDYLMVDLMRMGGVTQFRKVAAIAESFAIPVASHLIPEIFGQCIAALPNGLIVEGMPWTEVLFDGLPEFVDGRLKFSERPGLGLSLNEKAIAAYRQ